MKKHIRRLFTLCLCLMLICSASVASAAVSKTFTKVPTLKLTFSKRGVETDTAKELTINASAPGFLTLKLLSSSGAEVQTLLENYEIMSGNNTYDYMARDAAGNPMIPGNYAFSAVVVNQFGVSSKTVTKEFVIKEMSAESKAAAAERAAALAASAAANAGTAPAGAVVVGTGAVAAPAAPAATPIPVEITYTAGSFAAGEEGLMIGVGVNDAATQQNAGYWGLTSEATDAEIWAALTKTMVAVDIAEQESAYIYNSPKESRKSLGKVSGFSQGLNVVAERADGWSLVEAFRNEDGAFVRGYIRSNKLRTVEPDQNYGFVIDKATQTLIVYKDGARVGSAPLCTGLATSKYPHRETPAGEFVTATRRGTLEYYGNGYSKYCIRLNNTYYLSEIPTTKKNGSNYSTLESLLGSKATRGNICIAHAPSADGAINAEWIWNATDGRKRVKVLIFDDKPRTDVPVSSN